MLLTNLLIIGAAIVSIVLLVQLRALLSFTIPREALRWLPADTIDTLPSAMEKLYIDAIEQLYVIGFKDLRWAMIDEDPDVPSSFPLLIAILYHPEKNSMIYLMPPMLASTPNHLRIQIFTQLADGRQLMSESHDAYFRKIISPKLICHNLRGFTLEAQWEKHLSHLNQSGMTIAEPVGFADILTHLKAISFNERQYLLDNKKAWTDRGGSVHLTLLSALTAIKNLWVDRPALRHDNSPIPNERLAYIASIAKRQRQAALPSSTQWLLLSLSSFIFIIAGGLLWDFEFTIIILGIVIFHEAGHYIAMKMAGYGNVQMVAIPLFGGAAIGTPTNPSATKDAWISIMGPLPGIILGFLLLTIIYLSGMEPSRLLLTIVSLLLLINYLNLIPVLPLDGGNITQAILPPRWNLVRVIVIIVTSIAGIIGALFFNIYLLVALFILPLFSIPSLIRNNKIIKLYRDNEEFKQLSSEAQYIEILTALENLLGYATNAQERINQAESIIRTLEENPMRKRMRIGLTIFYFALFLPIIVIAILGFSTFIERLLYNSSEWEQNDKFVELYLSYKSLADNLTLEEIIDELYDEPLVPATREDIAATEDRLGAYLTPELNEIYSINNGFNEYQLDPIDALKWASNIPQLQRLPIDHFKIYDVLNEEADDSSDKSITLPKALNGWIVTSFVAWAEAAEDDEKELEGGERERDHNYQFTLYQLSEVQLFPETRWVDCYIDIGDNSFSQECMTSYNFLTQMKLRWINKQATEALDLYEHHKDSY